MYLYIFFEIAYLFLILINFILNKYSEIFRIGPTIMSVIYISISKNKKEKPNIYLILSMIFSLSGDIFFLLIDRHTLGIASFIIVQMFYFFFLKEKSNKILFLVLLNFIISIIFGEKILIIEAIVYAIIFITSIITAFKSVKNKEISPLFLIALFSLLTCDINVAILNKIDLSKSLRFLCSSIEWINYISNLIIITLLSNGSIRRKNRMRVKNRL